MNRHTAAIPVLIGALGALICAGALAQRGVPEGVIGAMVLIERLLVPVAVAAAWFASAWGLGATLMRVRELRPGNNAAVGIDDGQEPDDARGAHACVECAVGAALLVVMTNAVGSVWLPVSAGLAWFALAPGLALAAWRARRIDAGALFARAGGGAHRWVWLASVPALGALLFACALPAGTMWASEAFGYDSLSYHLQLPREWIGLGRVAPLEHNVYSHLPSGMEAVYAHAAALTGGVPGATSNATLVANVLHAGFVVLGAWCVCACVRSVVVGSCKNAGGALGGAMMIAVPWAVVTGSSAYNEAAVNALFACACALAIGERRAGAAAPLLRGVLIGVVCGAAALCKPTALFMAVPTVTLIVLTRTSRRDWWRVLGAAALVGVVCLSPWLVRNALATGNPVFPYATGVFGAGHWTPEQAARWSAGHHAGTWEDVGVVERARLLLFDVGDGGVDAAGQARGFAHPQWSVTLWLGVMGAAVAIALSRGKERAVTLALAGGCLLQLVAWAALTHLQSRFLLPALVPIAVLIGLGCARVIKRVRMRTVGESARTSGRAEIARRNAAAYALVCTACALPILYLSVRTVVLTAQERGGTPASALAFGVETLNGGAYRDMFAQAEDREQAELLTSIGAHAGLGALDALGVIGGGRVLMIGDATPLYVRTDVGYATTWDRNAYARALVEHDGDLKKAVGALRANGYTHALVSFGELDRLRSSGWLDPALTPGAVLGLMRTSRLVYAWDREGRVLIELPR